MPDTLIPAGPRAPLSSRYELDSPPTVKSPACFLRLRCRTMGREVFALRAQGRSPWARRPLERSAQSAAHRHRSLPPESDDCFGHMSFIPPVLKGADSTSSDYSTNSEDCSDETRSSLLVEYGTRQGEEAALLAIGNGRHPTGSRG